jgi:hypothetical protein
MQELEKKKSIEDIYLSRYDGNISEDTMQYLMSTVEDSCDDEQDTSGKIPVYLRFDVAANQYQTAIHPCAHLHVGIGNEIRVSSSLILSPEMFTMFAVKMTYPDIWKAHCSDTKIQQCHADYKKQCEKVQEGYWDKTDQLDLFLG